MNRTIFARVAALLAAASLMTVAGACSSGTDFALNENQKPITSASQQTTTTVAGQADGAGDNQPDAPEKTTARTKASRAAKTTLPTTASGLQYQITGGHAVVTRYRGSDNKVTIPSTLGGYTVTEIAAEAFADRKRVQSVTIPSTVTTVGDKAFYNCNSLRTITLPNSVTKLGTHVFELCVRLTQVTLPAGITAIPEGTFRDCEALNRYTIPSGVKTIGNTAFRYCKALSSLTIPAGVTSIGADAFAGCEKLTTLDLPDSLRTIGENAFANCRRSSRRSATGCSNIVVR